MPDFMELMAKGISKNMPEVMGSVKDLVTKMQDSMQGIQMPELALAGASASGAAISTTNNHTTNLGGLSVIVNGYNVQDDDALAAKIADKINDMMEEDNAVFK